MPKQTARDAEFWKFPSLAERQMRQVRAHDVATGTVSIARACKVTNTYYLVRCRAPEDGKMTMEHMRSAGLGPDAIHFVIHNQTPAERARGR